MYYESCLISLHPDVLATAPVSGTRRCWPSPLRPTGAVASTWLDRCLKNIREDS